MDSVVPTSETVAQTQANLQQFCREPRPRKAKANLRTEEILNLMEGSDLSDISSDEESVELYRVSDEDEGPNESDTLSESEYQVVTTSNDLTIIENTCRETAINNKRRKERGSYLWKKQVYPIQEIPFQDEFREVPSEPLTPRQYFKKFITTAMLEHIATQTNLYSSQKSGMPLCTTADELEKLLGMYFRMGLIQMPRIRAYWETGTRCNLIADVMSRNRFEKLVRYLHFVDNSTEEIQRPPQVANDGTPGASAETRDLLTNDKCWKIRPFITDIRKNFLQIEEESKCSVDEVLIPFRGRCRIKQYIKNKPHCKWGLKLWARAGESGIMYDLDMYQGTQEGKYGDQSGYNFGLGAGITLQLASTMNTDRNRLLITDNYFTGVDLVNELSKRGIFFIGTVSEKRLKNCNLKSKKEMKDLGRGAMDFRVTSSSSGKDLVAVKWFDNRQCILLSNFVGVQPETDVQRWDKKKKEKIMVQCPAIIPAYNRSMGGVDLLDNLTYKYKFEIRCSRWYMYIFWHLVQVAAVNSWLLHRRHARIMGRSSDRLRIFLADLATSLILAEKKRPGRPSLQTRSSPTLPPKKVAKTRTPRDVQKDAVSHWPIWNPKRNRCNLCKTQNSHVACEKCGEYLCFNKDRNCFNVFHM